MVVRKRRSALTDHPARMNRFELSEWPQPPVEGFAAWRGEYLAYWRYEKHPGGIYGLLGTIQAARLLVTTGEVRDPEELARKKADRAWR